MPISSDRMNTDIESIAAFTETRGMHDRPTFSRSWRQARDYIAHQAAAAGCSVRIDSAGNLHARHAEMPWDVQVWLSGSHVDSVPTGGKYDGVVGVVVALECLRAAKEDGFTIPLELIVFAEEEGTTFGYGMMGSRLWAGAATALHVADFRNKAGQNFFQAGAPHGVNELALAGDRLFPDRYLGMIEVHIEQGPTLWEAGEPLAVVTSIAGRKQYQAVITGVSNHAGSTPMGCRSDALLETARIVVELERVARNLSGATVITVGRIVCEPNAINVIPGRVVFTIDFRSPDEAVLTSGHSLIEQVVLEGGSGRSLRITEEQPVVTMDLLLCAGLLHGVGRPIPETSSGALHDAAIIAPLLPTAMIFIASRGGLSHHPDEFSRIQDITAAAEVLYRAVARGDQSSVSIMELNRYGRNAFVALVGPVFEHSPWIAQHTWSARPFENVNALHEALCQTMYAAEMEHQMALICAHPDLVGRLGDRASLTSNSKAEQSSAGLNEISDEEASAFARYNAAYRARFGFPFIICARENKKTAIIDAFPVRLQNTPDQEIAIALSEIAKIARLRLQHRVYDPA